MGERKGQNLYYPPDFDPVKHGNLNAYHGTHALRERAARIKEGILIIRFEMPYNIWCGGCSEHIGMGVRYNAEKTRAGMYYSTPIYKFGFKCHLCHSWIEIQTDPENRQYKIVSGARRVEQRWDPKDNEQIYAEERDVKKRMATDPMFKLEHGQEDAAKKAKAGPRIRELQKFQERTRDEDLLNKAARQIFREEKKARAETEAVDQDLLQRSSLDLPLLPETSEDRQLAHLMQYHVSKKDGEERQKETREEIISKRMFPVDSSSSSSTSSASVFSTPSVGSTPEGGGGDRDKKATQIASLRKKIDLARDKAHDPFSAALLGNKAKAGGSNLLGIVRKKPENKTTKHEDEISEVAASVKGLNTVKVVSHIAGRGSVLGMRDESNVLPSSTDGDSTCVVSGSLTDSGDKGDSKPVVGLAGLAGYGSNSESGAGDSD